MQDIWRKTVEALKSYPTLLLTLVAASLVGFYLERLNKALAGLIIRWVATTHSVLGFETQSPDPSAASRAKALLCALPISLCLRLTIFSAYIVGFVVAARLARDLIQGERPDWPAAFRFLRLRILRIILFAVVILVLIALGLFLAAELINLKIFAFLHTILPFDIEVAASAFVVCSCIAWVLIPFSLRLIVDSPSQPISRKGKTNGRIASIAAVAICFALNKLSTSFTPSINLAFVSEAWLRHFVIWPGISILGDLPLVFLWVFLALVAYEGLQFPEIPSPS